eukprot:NODE_13662_length_1153_cov_4.778752.p1 GENE.NODE_13662_length_1153_cov_4.778752~~NODE_13662_length_1153_cov_4.778752.p1  ORF type:complete len:281 (-),score=46.99 NODE_13662_length_1153_cov_4.778752:210-1052(-)
MADGGPALELVQICRDGARRGELQLTAEEREQMCQLGFSILLDTDEITCNFIGLDGTLKCTLTVPRSTTSGELTRLLDAALAEGPILHRLMRLVLHGTVLLAPAAQPLRSVGGNVAAIVLVRGDSLIENGDFESGSLGEIPAKWRRYDRYGDTGLISVEDRRWGRQCAKFRGYRWQLIETDCVQLTAGEVYELSFWARSTGGGMVRTEFLRYPSPAAKGYCEQLRVREGNFAKPHDVDNAWALYTHEIQPVKDAACVRINIGPNDAAGDVYIDCVCLQRK